MMLTNYMGNYLASYVNNDTDKYEELRRELDTLFNRIDTNHDNMVTQDEMQVWTEKHKKSLGELKQQKKELEAQLKTIQESFKQTLDAKEIEIRKLKSDLNLETAHRKRLEEQNQNLMRIMDDNDDFTLQNPVAKSVISSTLISQYVDEILKNEKINIDYLPDSVEKAIYKNVLRLLLLLVDKIGEQTTIDLFGHKLRIIVTQ